MDQMLCSRRRCSGQTVLIDIQKYIVVLREENRVKYLNVRAGTRVVRKFGTVSARVAFLKPVVNCGYKRVGSTGVRSHHQSAPYKLYGRMSKLVQDRRIQCQQLLPKYERSSGLGRRQL